MTTTNSQQTQTDSSSSSPSTNIFSKRGAVGIIAPAFVVVVGAVTLVSLYNFWRIEQVQENVESAGQFYIPALKQLNLINGKWQAYQRSFEQNVGFRKWGSSTAENGQLARLPLKKMVEPNMAELGSRLEKLSPARKNIESAELDSWLSRISRFSDREQTVVAEIASLVKAKHFGDAAALYSRTRQEQIEIAQGLADLSVAFEARLSDLQSSTEQELRVSQNVMLLLLFVSLVFSFVVLFRLRRWLMPIVEWTGVAQEIALRGVHRDVRFPRITRGMPPEIQLLTSEFTRMGMTVLERERTIHQQKDKVESLNSRLKEQNERLARLGSMNERILNGMSAGLLVVNLEGKIEHFNERYCRLFSADRNKMLSRPLVELLREWPAPLPGEVIRELLLAGSGKHLSRVKVEGQVFDIEVIPLDAKIGKLLKFEDVTRLVEAEEKLAHARKLMLAGDLSSQVAHEVRNPLNSMSLQLEMLEEDLLTEFGESANQNKGLIAAAAGPAGPALTAASILDRVRTIDEQVQRLDRLTQRYLDVQRPSVDRQDYVNVHALIERCLMFLSGEIQAARVTVELGLKATHFYAKGDGDALSQVLFNLVRNSLEAMADSSSRILGIATFDAGGTVHIRVSDSGSGIDLAVQGRIFEPFVTHKPNGQGVGLSLSRQICIEHGGELKLLESGAEDLSRTTFEMTLPSTDAEESFTNIADSSSMKSLKERDL